MQKQEAKNKKKEEEKRKKGKKGRKEEKKEEKKKRKKTKGKLIRLMTVGRNSSGILYIRGTYIQEKHSGVAHQL